MGTSGTFLGCASHPNGQPGAVIVPSVANWLTAHEVGHVLDLRHVNDSTRLMLPNVGWTQLPPVLTDDEAETMQGSEFAQDF